MLRQIRAERRRELAMLRRSQAFYAPAAYDYAYAEPQTLYYAPVRTYRAQPMHRGYRPRYAPAADYYPSDSGFGGLLGGGGGGLLGGGGMGDVLTAILPLVLTQVVGDGLGDAAGQALGASSGFGFREAAPASFAGLDPAYHDAYADPSVGYAYDDGYAADPDYAGGDDGLLATVGSAFGSGLLGDSLGGLGGGLLGGSGLGGLGGSLLGGSSQSGLGGFGSQYGEAYDGGYGVDPESLIAQAVIPQLLG